MLNTSERRQSPRVAVNNHPDLPGSLRDVGLGGFSLELPDMLPIGTVQDFDLKVGRRSRVTLRGRVAHSAPERGANGRTVYVTGLEFLADMTPETRVRLKRTA